MLLLGLSGGLWVVNLYNTTHILALGYALISALLTIAGMIMLSTALTLHSVRGLLYDFLRSSRGNGAQSSDS
jgi:hypothetical protein